MEITIPNPGRGRRSAERDAEYRSELQQFYEALQEINSSIDITVSSRGWCYLLEEHGLTKGDFSRAEKLINDGRKDGSLPTDICSVDEARALGGVEVINYSGVDSYAQTIVESGIESYVQDYYPSSQWELQDQFIIMAVEKKDLVEIFKPVCQRYGIPLANFKGWSDINSRLAFMRLFQEWEEQDKQCVLLYCGDHDPGGLHISDQLRKNLNDLSGTWSHADGAMDWYPDDLIIDHFGLNYDFIQQHNLSWVENLITGSGRDLASPTYKGKRNKEHFKLYVQEYIAQYGARKVEANALVTRIDAGRELCKQAILKYIDTDALSDHRGHITEQRSELREEVARLIEAA